MAISLVQTKSVTSNGSSPASISMATTTTGNLVIVGAVTDDNSVDVTSITATGMTFTQIFQNHISTGPLYASLWYAKNITGATTPSISINWSAAGFISAIAREYSGLDTSAPLDQSPAMTSSTGSLNPLSATTATTSVANELLIGIVADSWGAGQTYTVGTGYGNLTSIVSTSSWDISLEDRIVSATGTYNAGLTLGNSTSWIAGIATFKAAGAAAVMAHNLTMMGVGS